MSLRIAPASALSRRSEGVDSKKAPGKKYRIGFKKCRRSGDIKKWLRGAGSPGGSRTWPASQATAANTIRDFFLSLFRRHVFPEDLVGRRGFVRGRLESHRLWSAHPDDPCGRDRLSFGGAEGATGPGNSQANGPQEDGSLESGGRLIWRAPTDEVSRHFSRRIFQVSGQRGSRTAQSLRRVRAT